MKNVSLDEKKVNIQDLGLTAIEDYFGVDVVEFSQEELKHLHQKARIGMQFEREMNVSTRAVEMNYLRVFKLMAADKKEMKKYVRAALPQYVPKVKR